MLSFVPRDVLDEILNLIESVSEGFPTYSLEYFIVIVCSYLFIHLLFISYSRAA